MADVKWIKFYVSILTNPKIKRIRRMPDGNTIALIWAYLLAQAGESNKNGAIYFTEEIAYSADDFAIQYDFELDTVRLAIATFERFGMIGVFDGIIYIKNWEKYQSVDSLEKMREQNRIRQLNYKERRKIEQSNVIGNVIDNAEITHGNDTDIELELDIDNTKDIVRKTRTEPVTKIELDNFFEKIWELYPVKKGKGSVSDKQKKKLYAIGFDEIAKAIDRYKKDIIETETQPQFVKHGSTFFNSGYIGYLDANYVPSENKKPKSKNSFNNIPESAYGDMTDLERDILAN